VSVLMVLGLGLVGFAGCSSDDPASPDAEELGTPLTAVSPETTATVANETVRASEAFCAVYASAPTSVPESYVGSEENVAEVERLLEVSPEPVHASVQIVRDHLASGAVTSDPETKLRSNWPPEVQQAIDDLFAYVAANC
jgi:hypothetical protein